MSRLNPLLWIARPRLTHSRIEQLLTRSQGSELPVVTFVLSSHSFTSIGGAIDVKRDYNFVRYDDRATAADRVQIPSLARRGFSLWSTITHCLPPRIIQSGHMFPDVSHEENRAIFREERSCSGILDWHGKAEPAFGLVPKLPVTIETEPDLLVVY